jgi:hypothetical protein
MASTRQTEEKSRKERRNGERKSDSRLSGAMDKAHRGKQDDV